MQIRPSRLFLVFWFTTVSSLVWAQQEVTYVIGPEMQPVVANMLDTSASGWSLKSAQIKGGTIAATFEHKTDGSAQVNFGHSKSDIDGALVVGDFAFKGAKGVIPSALLEELKKRVKMASDKFEWKSVQEGVDGKSGAGGQGSGAMSTTDRNSVAEVERIFASAWDGSDPNWRKALDKLLARKGLHPEVLFAVAVNLRDRDERDPAKAMFQRTLSTVNKSAEATPRLKLVRGGTLLALGKTTEGLAELDEALALKDSEHPVEPCRMLDAIKLGTGQGNGEAYRAWVDAFAKKHVDCISAPTIVALDYEARGQDDQAIKVIEQLLKNGKPEIKALDRLAGLYVKVGKPHDAVRVYRDICSRGSCTDRVRGNLVWAQSGFHRHPKIIEEYVAKGLAAPDNILLQFEVGVMLHYAQRYEESDKFLENAKVLWPKDPRILIYTSMNAYRSGRQKEAEKKIEFAFDAATKKDPDLFYCRAVIFRNSDLPKAIENLQRYLDVMNRRGGSVEKQAMVNSFMGNMKAELKRREAGEPARPFADPEESFFGEPPGSPGLAENAIHVLEKDQGPGPIRRPHSKVAPHQTKTTNTPSAEPPEVEDNAIIFAGLALLVLAALSFWMQRRKSE